MFDWYDVYAWPAKWRRLFVLLLPISGPIWLAAVTVSVLLMLVFAAVLAPLVFVMSLWEGRDGESK